MDLAICTLDDVTYISHEFSLLAPDEINRLRYDLVCSECGNRAFYRKASCSGQPASFGAKPHAEGCSFAIPERCRLDTAFGDDEDPINNYGERILIDFNFGGTVRNLDEAGMSERNKTGHTAHYRGDNLQQRDLVHRRLSSLLRNLIESEIFRNSNHILDIQGYGKFVARDFFRHFDEISHDNLNDFKGYWGKIRGVKADKSGSLWFNFDVKNNVGAILDSGFKNYVVSRYGGVEKIAGAYILVFGVLRVSKSDMLYIKIEEPNLFVLRLTTK